MKLKKNKMRFKKLTGYLFPEWDSPVFLEKNLFFFFSGLDKIKNLFIINTELRKRLTEY